jgi:hypothetical protein
MSGIVQSLFGLTPIRQEVEQQLRGRDLDFGTLFGAATANQYVSPARQQAYIQQQGAQSALGGMAVRGIGSLFGIEDPQLKRASTLEGILQSTQMDLGENANNPTAFYPELQKRLAVAGFTREAQQVGEASQKAIQDSTLNQAKLLTEQAQLAKATTEKQPEIVRLQQALKQARAMGDTETANAIQAQIQKNTFIAEKEATPQNRAEDAVLNKYTSLYPGNPGLAGEAFLEYKSNLRQKEAAAGVAPGKTEPIDIARLDTSYDKFVTPHKEKLSLINEALKLAEQALTNPQAGVRLNELLVNLYQGGKISNQDIARTANPGSLPAQVLQNFNKIISGTDTETNIKDKYALLKSLQQGVANSLNESVDAWAERWSTAPGVSQETISTYTKGSKFKFNSKQPKTAEEYLKGL